VPVPEPDARWTEKLSLTEQTAAKPDLTRERCLFAERCPHVMDRCWVKRPAMIDVRPGQEALCFLYGPGSGYSVPTPSEKASG
jgi:ABC-type dipeptide/oligopeptide/nickel transport system ATPase component